MENRSLSIQRIIWYLAIAQRCIRRSDPVHVFKYDRRTSNRNNFYLESTLFMPLLSDFMRENQMSIFKTAVFPDIVSYRISIFLRWICKILYRLFTLAQALRHTA